MSAQLQQILQQAALLSPQEQLVLVASISQLLVQQDFGTDLDSQAFTLSAEEEHVVYQRMKQIQTGETQSVPWKEALAMIRKRHDL